MSELLSDGCRVSDRSVCVTEIMVDILKTIGLVLAPNGKHVMKAQLICIETSFVWSEERAIRSQASASMPRNARLSPTLDK